MTEKIKKVLTSLSITILFMSLLTGMALTNANQSIPEIYKNIIAMSQMTKIASGYKSLISLTITFGLGLAVSIFVFLFTAEDSNISSDDWPHWL